MKREQFETENFLGLYLWLAMIVVSLLLYLFFPETFTPKNIRQFFSANLYTGLSVFFFAGVIAGVYLDTAYTVAARRHFGVPGLAIVFCKSRRHPSFFCISLLSLALFPF